MLLIVFELRGRTDRQTNKQTNKHTQMHCPRTPVREREGKGFQNRVLYLLCNINLYVVVYIPYDLHVHVTYLYCSSQHRERKSMCQNKYQ